MLDIVAVFCERRFERTIGFQTNRQKSVSPQSVRISGPQPKRASTLWCASGFSCMLCLPLVTYTPGLYFKCLAEFKEFARLLVCIPSFSLHGAQSLVMQKVTHQTNHVLLQMSAGVVGADWVRCNISRSLSTTTISSLHSHPHTLLCVSMKASLLICQNSARFNIMVDDTNDTNSIYLQMFCVKSDWIFVALPAERSAVDNEAPMTPSIASLHLCPRSA